MTQQQQHQQENDLKKWLGEQDLHQDPVWVELRSVYGPGLSDSQWENYVARNALDFLGEFVKYSTKMRPVITPTRPGGSTAVSPKARGNAVHQELQTSSSLPAQQQLSTQEFSSLPQRLAVMGKAVTKRNRLLIGFVVSLFLFFSFFDWQTSRYGVLVGAEAALNTDLGGLLKLVGEMIVLIMIFAESLLQLLNRLVRLMGYPSVFQIENGVIRFWLLVGYAIMITLLLSNYWFSFVPVVQLYGPVIAVCLAVLPTVFQVVLFEVILGYLFNGDAE